MTVTLPQYHGTQVLVIGDVMLDRYWYGSSHRISPEAPVPIVKIQQMEERPGGAANVAMNIASLGADVRLVGLIGVDNDAQILKSALRVAKVDGQLIAHSAYTTLTKLRIMSRNQQLLRLDFEEAFFQNDTPPLLTHIQQCSLLPLPGAMVLSDYGKGTLSDIQPIIQLGRTAGIPVLVDPKGVDFSRYQGATLLTPNLNEFEAVVGHCHSEHALVDRGMQLLDDYHLTALLITRSEQGMTLLRRQQPPLHLPTQAREIYDVTGAGDTVIAVLAASLAAGTTLDIACILANVAAGLVVSKLGTATVSMMELEKSVLGLETSAFGITSELLLKQAVAEARRRGERIVMTNGCFDILHAGHVTYLARARQLGDRLIVAVNDDASVRHLKGNSRPINPLTHRMQILAALSSVDWVVPFSEETPERLIADILPDFLVKGGDYLPETIAGAQAVWKAGGKVQVLDFVAECSTTVLIQNILRSKP